MSVLILGCLAKQGIMDYLSRTRPRKMIRLKINRNLSRKIKEKDIISMGLYRFPVWERHFKQLRIQWDIAIGIRMLLSLPLTRKVPRDSCHWHVRWQDSIGMLCTLYIWDAMMCQLMS